jgi:opacity protein-like surface antigen
MFLIFTLYSQFKKNIFVGMIKKVVFLFMFLPVVMMAQQWKKQKREIILGMGAANFLGDVGGADQIGTYFLKDIEFSQTKSHVQAGYRYRFTPTISAKASFSYARVAGSDRLTKEPSRRNRDLEFRSDIWEVAAQFEYSLVEEHIKGRYIRGKTRFPVNIYLFGGIGFLHFNPKSRVEFQGDWIALQPLGTEGQGNAAFSNIEPYNTSATCFPVGMGVKYSINPSINLSFEASYRFTSTDYLDDVSTTYAGANAFPSVNGQPSISYLLQDRSYELGNVIGQAGKQRGFSQQKDQYLFVELGIAWTITSYRCPSAK